MRLLLLLALLVGAVSAKHFSSEVSSLESPRRAESLAQDGEKAERVAGEAPAGALMPLQEGDEVEEEAEGDSGSEDSPEEEERVEPSSELDMGHMDIQCPKEEDAVKLVGSPGCKTCRYVVLSTPRTFNEAQLVCQRCYRGSLASIHSFAYNYQLQCTSRTLNAGQIWIGGQLVGRGRCRRFLWLDKSAWNFAYWAAGQPWGGYHHGRCVTLCTRGGHWRLSHCGKRRPFACSY
ncbi:bone marrow proteoglycan [Octodon degus]|uniref:Bone marrow proteoglycan n=1 Tax=Octodon degus TaxID=10160 RepID=A0A6P3FH80_OCTDE|nr:bone marrow proteoglycan [Octodon degus]